MRDGRRPEWWPSGEPWPPRRTAGARVWSRWRRYLAWRVIGVAVAVAVVAGGAGAMFGLAHRRGPESFPFFPFLAFPLAFLLIRAGLKRTWSGVRRLTAAAGRLADGEYSARVAVPPGGPLRPVVSSFNQMAERLEQSDLRRRRLLADLGHELRNPLTIFRGSVEAMIDEVHAPDRANLEALLDEVGVMERLLEDLRTMSLAEAGRLTLHLETIDPVELVSETIASLIALTEEVEVLVEAGSHPSLVEVDPVRIREVITNLVVNSLRAMPDGGRLEARVEIDRDRLRVSIADTGEGIDDERLPHIFDRFVKGAGSPGSGLGLTIARDLVEAHGGEISARSQPGAGTIFEFWVPV